MVNRICKTLVAPIESDKTDRYYPLLLVSLLFFFFFFILFHPLCPCFLLVDRFCKR